MALLRDPEVDLLDAKLAIDAQLDGATDAAGRASPVDAWVDAARARTPARLPADASSEHLLSTLYVAGPWNGQRPVAYDSKIPSHASHAVACSRPTWHTRRGNCVTHAAARRDRRTPPRPAACARRAPQHCS
jgi:hypothetical protein